MQPLDEQAPKMNGVDINKFGEILIFDIHFESATLETAKTFKDFLMEYIDNGEKKIIIDCSKVKYMDSTFLGVLVFTLKKLVSASGDLKLIMGDVNNPVWTMFETTRMFRVFKTYDDIGHAVKGF